MSFEQALSGLSAASKNLDVIGNNISNANTIGFKESQAHFADLYAGSLAATANTAVGIGTTVSAVAQSFAQGAVTTTSNPLDMAINGKGFFALSQNGTSVYSRNGQFNLDKNGYIVNDAGARLTGYAASATGIAPSATPTDLSISTADVAPKASSLVNADLNLDSRSTALSAAAFNASDSSTYNYATSVNVYDTLGNSHALSLYFVQTGPNGSGENAWKVFAANDGTAVGSGAAGTLNFKSDGSVDTATSSIPLTISATLANGATSPLAVNLDFSKSTQYGASASVNQLTQDGYASGRLSNYSISDDGTIQGSYTNGQSKTLGQVALVDFIAPEGLKPLGNNEWAETAKSGAALVGAPGSGSLGSLQSGALEQANVDLTAELVNMITAQRNYQANAQTIKTEDSLLQTLVTLR